MRRLLNRKSNKSPLLYFSKSMIITLTGFMGVGKSTVASRLANHLYCNCADLDTLIEQGEGMLVEEIFSKRGEGEFRKLEETYLENLIAKCKDKVLVVSLGGGALLSHKNRFAITENTFCIYLKASTDTIANRLAKAHKSRPLVKDKSEDELRKEVERLFKEREPGYESAAKLIVNVDNISVREILSTIMDSI